MDGRQLEMLNIFVGFEQANRYVICQLLLLGHDVCETEGALLQPMKLGTRLGTSPRSRAGSSQPSRGRSSARIGRSAPL